MRKLISVFLALIICICLCACGGSELSTSAVKLSEGYESEIREYRYFDRNFKNAQNKLTSAFFANVCAKNTDSNVLISPVSLTSVLTALANGADKDTKGEIEKFLGLETQDLNHYVYSFFNFLPKSSTIKNYNSLWLKNDQRFSVRDDFLQANANFFNADIFKLPFDDSTAKEINKWVSNATKGEIESIVDKIEKNSYSYFINALTFDAEWQNAYSTDSITSDLFKTPHGNVSAEFMLSRESLYIKTNNSTGFIKPYKNDDYRFVALLPNDGVSIDEYIASLEFTTLDSIIANASEHTVVAKMPKFENKFDITLNSTLKDLGINNAFDMEKADFSKLGKIEGANLYLSEIKQKTYITVDNIGTKAGAVTKAEIAAKTSLEEQPYSVTLNRPFVYAIVHSESNIPIFIGKVIEP